MNGHGSRPDILAEHKWLNCVENLRQLEFVLRGHALVSGTGGRDEAEDCGKVWGVALVAMHCSDGDQLRWSGAGAGSGHLHDPAGVIG
jgi:hypothetical protein